MTQNVCVLHLYKFIEFSLDRKFIKFLNTKSLFVHRKYTLIVYVTIQFLLLQCWQKLQKQTTTELKLIGTNLQSEDSSSIRLPLTSRFGLPPLA